MIIKAIEEEFPWTKPVDRGDSVHVSDIIHDMDKELTGTSERVITDDVRMQFQKGYLWEVVLSRAFAEKSVSRPESIMVDGIKLSPDGLAVEGEQLVIEEYKCTSMSPDKSPADQWRWMMQSKAYCYGFGINLCVFRVLHLMFVPVYRPWRIRFTDAELAENWQEILNHKRAMEVHGE